MNLAIGMYVKIAGGSQGRIVDRRIARGNVELWLIKLTNKPKTANFVWSQAVHLTPITH